MPRVMVDIDDEAGEDHRQLADDDGCAFFRLVLALLDDVAEGAPGEVGHQHGVDCAERALDMAAQVGKACRRVFVDGLQSGDAAAEARIDEGGTSVGRVAGAGTALRPIGLAPCGLGDGALVGHAHGQCRNGIAGIVDSGDAECEEGTGGDVEHSAELEAGLLELLAGFGREILVEADIAQEGVKLDGPGVDLDMLKGRTTSSPVPTTANRARAALMP